MERRVYRKSQQQTRVGYISCAGLALMILAATVFSTLRAQHDGFILVILGVVCLMFVVAFLVPLIGAPLVVTDDGIRGFINYHPMRIPWSSVRSFEVRDLQGSEQAASLVVLHSNNGKQILMPCTAGTPAHAGGIAEELRQAHREHGARWTLASGGSY